MFKTLMNAFYCVKLYAILCFVVLISQTVIASEQTQFTLPVKIIDTPNDFQISPDNQYIVYIDGGGELFSVPISGGTPVRLSLNGDLRFVGNVFSFKISPDSKYVVYRADHNRDITDRFVEIFSVPIVGGSEPVRLNGDLPPVSNRVIGAVRDDFQISVDNQVVYTADQNQIGVFELFSVPIVGGSSIRLNDDLVPAAPSQTPGIGFPAGEVLDFQISPDGQRVVYRAEKNIIFVDELFTVPIMGGEEPVRLNTDLPFDPGSLIFGGGDVKFFQISANSQHVVYLANQNDEDIDELFSVPIAGGNPPVRLNIPLPSPTRDVRRDFQITPDSLNVVYVANPIDSFIDELFVTPIIGGPSLRLSIDFERFEGVEFDGFKVSSNSTNVVYLANLGSNNAAENELFHVPITGGNSVQLSDNLVPDGEVSDFQISPDGKHVIYLANQNAENVFELFRVPVMGGESTRLNRDFPEGIDVPSHSFDFQISPNSEYVIYRTTQNIDRVNEVFSVDITGGEPVRLNSELEPPTTINFRFRASQVFVFQISSDGQHVIYVSGPTIEGLSGLFLVEVQSSINELCMPIIAKNGNTVVICL